MALEHGLVYENRGEKKMVGYNYECEECGRKEVLYFRLGESPLEYVMNCNRFPQSDCLGEKYIQAHYRSSEEEGNE